jgi:hypothetical protein
MSEVQENVDNTTVDNGEVPILEQERVIDFITNPEEKLLALQELEVLSKLINTSYFMPKWDQGNKGKDDKKITNSVKLNFFSSKQLDAWGQRVTDLSERLGM